MALSHQVGFQQRVHGVVLFIEISVGLQQFRKNVSFYLKCLQVKMSWRSDGDRGVSTELL